jgi:hypothetical protein
VTRITSALPAFIEPPRSASPAARRGPALAGEPRLAHVGRLALERAIGGDRLTRAYQHEVSRRKARDGNGNRVLRARRIQAVGGLRHQPREVLQGIAGAMARTQLQVAPARQQEDEHGDRVEVDLARSRDGGDDARGERGRESQHDRHVHAEGAHAQVAPRAAEERRRGIGDHGQRQHQARPAHERGGIGGDLAVGGDVARPRVHHHLHHPEPRDPQAPQEPAALALLDEGEAPFLVGPGGVAERAHRGEDGAQLRRLRIPSHPRAARGVVQVEGSDSGHAQDHLLDEPGACRTAQPLEHQLRLDEVRLRGVAAARRHLAHEAFLHQRVVEDGEVGIGLVGGARRRRGAQAVVVVETEARDRLRHRLAARAAEDAPLAAGLVEEERSRRNRQAAMEAVPRRGRGPGRRVVGRHAGTSDL